MVVLNDLDRFHLVADVIDRVPAFVPRAAYALQAIRDKLLEHKQYIARHGEVMPEIRNWRGFIAQIVTEAGVQVMLRCEAKSYPTHVPPPPRG